MANIIDKGDDIIITGDFFDLKLDSSRKVYVRDKSEGYEKQFEYSDIRIPQGLSRHEKKAYLYNLYSESMEELGDGADEDE